MKVLALLLACGCHGAATRRAEAPDTVVVHPGELVDRVLLTGALHAASAIDLGVPIQGQLPIRWLVTDGAVVAAGDRVLELDNSELVTSLAEYHTQLRAAEAEFLRSREVTAKALADKRRAIRTAEIERDKAKLQADLPKDLITVRKADENRLALQQAEASLGEAQRALATLVDTNALDQRVLQITLEQTRRGIATADHAIQSLVVVAPRDGVVVVDDHPWEARKFHVGDKVQSDVPIVSMPDLGKPIEVRADLIDVDDGRISPNEAGTCTLDAYPADPIPCTAVELTPVASPKEGLDSLRRTFSVTLTLEHRDPARLRPGMSVKVELHRQPLRGLVIPRGAVIHHDHVRLASGEPREVTLAACDAQQCAVASGLVDGDVIATGAAP